MQCDFFDQDFMIVQFKNGSFYKLTLNLNFIYDLTSKTNLKIKKLILKSKN